MVPTHGSPAPASREGSREGGQNADTLLLCFISLPRPVNRHSRLRNEGLRGQGLGLALVLTPAMEGGRQVGGGWSLRLPDTVGPGQGGAGRSWGLSTVSGPSAGRLEEPQSVASAWLWYRLLNPDSFARQGALSPPGGSFPQCTALPFVRLHDVQGAAGRGRPRMALCLSHRAGGARAELVCTEG